jgi:hypothetical protein
MTTQKIGMFSVLLVALLGLMLVPSSSQAQNESWVTNQGGRGWEACLNDNGWGSSFSQMAANQIYPMLSDDACNLQGNTGSQDQLPWNYVIQGEVSLKAGTTATVFTVTAYWGTSCTASGTWPNETFSNCYSGAYFEGTVPAGDTVSVPFNILDPALPFGSCDGFYVVVEANKASTCLHGEYTTTEHDNPQNF